MGTLYVTMEEEEGAKPYLEEALTLDPELMGAYANLGIIHARKDDHEKAAAYFSEALRRDPDNSNLRNYIAETYLRLDLPDRAEEEYRSVLQVAPCNILAHVGLGQTLSALGDKGDTDAYTQAIFHLSEAISLAQSMRAGAPQQRKGSMRLTGKQLASVFYARGYARVRAYEARAEETVFTLRGDERLLRGAADDFKQATALNPEHYRAKRAVQRIEQRRKSLSPHTLAERRAPQVFVPLSLAMLALIQTSYFFGWPADSISDANYVLLTFGLLMFVAAGFYLPQLLKLKVGAVELEKKGSFEQLTTLMPLNIAIDVFPASFVSVVAADYSSSRVTTKKPPHEPIDVHRPSSVADVEAGARWDQANSGAPK